MTEKLISCNDDNIYIGCTHTHNIFKTSSVNRCIFSVCLNCDQDSLSTKTFLKKKKAPTDQLLLKPVVILELGVPYSDPTATCSQYPSPLCASAAKVTRTVSHGGMLQDVLHHTERNGYHQTCDRL